MRSKYKVLLVLPLLAGKGRLHVPVPRVASVYCSVRFVQHVFDMTSEEKIF